MTDESVVTEATEDSKVSKTGNDVVLSNDKTDDTVTLSEYQDDLTYTIPSADNLKDEQKHMAGQKVKKAFTFGAVEAGDTDTAAQVMEVKGLNIVDYVNEYLKSNARSSCYQSTAALYKISKLTAEQVLERSIKDMIRGGIPEDIARAAVAGAKASVAAG